MEILGLIAIILGWVFFGKILGFVLAVIVAFFQSVFGSGSFFENFKAQYAEAAPMEPFQIKGERKQISDEGSFEVIELMGKGILPLKERTNVRFVTSIIDITEDESFLPVLSALDDFQESDTRAFQHTVHAGRANPNSGYADWSRVGVMIPSLLVPPKSGTRKLAASVWVIDDDNQPPFALGMCNFDHPGLIQNYEYHFEETFEDKGYQEEAEHRAEARSLIIKLGVQVAMADGDFADEEGAIIKEWIEKSLATYNSDDRRKELKKTYNKAFKDGFSKAKKGTLSISEITEQLNDIASKSQKYEALELCFDVMAADGVADEEELTTIKNISEALNLDYDEIQNMKDQRMITLSTTVDAATNAEAMLGIEADWSNEKIQKHLRKEFTKWNGRINALPEGEERENAQRMLDLIAEARKKYGQES